MGPSQFCILVLVSLSLISCASPQVHYDPGLDDSAPQARTKYSTIVEAFDRANRAPNVSDFDPLDEFHPKTHCFLTRASTPEVMGEVVIRQMSVTYSGTPSYGPLFPGDPDRIETILVLGKDTAWVNSTNLTNEKRQVFELHPMGVTLVIKINENQFGIYQDFGNPAEIWLRKSPDGNIFFKVFKVDTERNRTEASVGYCFKK
jgi:hypothetical protein